MKWTCLIVTRSQQHPIEPPNFIRSLVLLTSTDDNRAAGDEYLLAWVKVAGGGLLVAALLYYGRNLRTSLKYGRIFLVDFHCFKPPKRCANAVKT